MGGSWERRTGRYDTHVGAFVNIDRANVGI